MSGVLKNILEEFSARKYFVEYGPNNFSNHVAHGIIALNYLGASETDVRKYAKWHIKEKEIKTVKDEGKAALFDQLKGARSHYFTVLSHFESVHQNVSIRDIIVKHFPDLLPGLTTALFHPLISMGYGIWADHPQTVLEGLAYFYFAYAEPNYTDKTQLFVELKSGETSLPELLNQVRNDSAFLERIKEMSLDPTSPGSSVKFKRRQAILNEADHLLGLVNQIKLPSNITQTTDLNHLGNFLIKTATTLYTGIDGKNDFFFLHGVTASWALKNVLGQFADAEAGVVRRVANATVRTFLVSLLYVYVLLECPEISEPKFNSESSWEEIVKKALANPESDEHVFKLVQVCKQMGQECPVDAELYKIAASRAVDFPLFFAELSYAPE